MLSIVSFLCIQEHHRCVSTVSPALEAVLLYHSRPVTATRHSGPYPYLTAQDGTPLVALGLTCPLAAPRPNTAAAPPLSLPHTSDPLTTTEPPSNRRSTVTTSSSRRRLLDWSHSSACWWELSTWGWVDTREMRTGRGYR